MININEICSKVAKENADNYVDKIKLRSTNDEFESKVRYTKGLMEYSNLLLETYHKELKEELAKQNINI